MKFVRIPAGSFSMGSDNGDGDERPAHHVTISRPFELQATEVTQAQWLAVMGISPSNFHGDDLPVENVSWNDVQEFIRKLNQLDPGKGYRLPTEAEWEYACRAGTTGEQYGDLGSIAWYIDNSGSRTHPVGQKRPNAWGLYDMLGNVWEWCSDWDGKYPTESVTDPAGPSAGSNRVSRGGGWVNDAVGCRSANRYYYEPGSRFYLLGFRLARGETISTDNSVQKMETNLPTVVTPSEIPSDNLSEMKFATIPAGSFLMGSESIDSNARPHRVTISRPFELQTTEVTQAQWKAVMGGNPSNFKGDDLPVEQVSWNDCQEFIRKLNQLDPGKNYRLPTEAEWEYACRAGTAGDRYGDLDAVAWYEGNSGNRTHPVGQKQPNAWGLYDMLGNVCEWCADVADWYGGYPSGHVTGAGGPLSGPDRVYRGGDWSDEDAGCRSALRGGFIPGGRLLDLGFRVARGR